MPRRAPGPFAALSLMIYIRGRCSPYTRKVTASGRSAPSHSPLRPQIPLWRRALYWSGLCLLPQHNHVSWRSIPYWLRLMAPRLPHHPTVDFSRYVPLQDLSVPLCFEYCSWFPSCWLPTLRHALSSLR